MPNEKKKIMLAAKEKPDSLEIIRTLNGMGYGVTSFAENDAVKKNSTDKTDLVLIDIDWKKGSTCINTAKTISKKCKVPVIFLHVPPYHIFPKGKFPKIPVSFVYEPLNNLELQAAIEMVFINESFFISN